MNNDVHQKQEPAGSVFDERFLYLGGEELC